jgi:hypothetical protein
MTIKESFLPAMLIACTLAACSDSPTSFPSAPSAADIVEAATLAAPGTCPAGFTLVQKSIDGVDLNQNGWVCADERGQVVDDVLEEDPGTCPAGFDLRFKPGGFADLNGNGWICVDANGNAVDDILREEGPDTEFAGGHGNFIDHKQDISFSFHGKQNKQMVVKGEFEMHDQTFDVRIHGNVTCLRLEGNRGTLGGVITQSTDPSFSVGQVVVWETVDEGEGINEPVDLLSRPSKGGKDPKKDCQRGMKFSLVKIQSGNIQVLH